MTEDAYKFQENYFIADYKYKPEGVSDLKQAAIEILKEQLKIPIAEADILENATVETVDAKMTELKK